MSRMIEMHPISIAVVATWVNTFVKTHIYCIYILYAIKIYIAYIFYFSKKYIL